MKTIFDPDQFREQSANMGINYHMFQALSLEEQIKI